MNRSIEAESIITQQITDILSSVAPADSLRAIIVDIAIKKRRETVLQRCLHNQNL